jgi:hypothetical protein
MVEKQFQIEKQLYREKKEIQLTVNGHPVTLCFSDKPNHELADRIKKLLTESYVKQQLKAPK